MELNNICNNCQVVEMPGKSVIFSYGTPVLSITGNSGNYMLHRHWDGWSATTQRHINKSLDFLGFSSKFNKKMWDSMAVEYEN